MILDKKNLHYENYFNIKFTYKQDVVFYSEFDKIEDAQRLFDKIVYGFIHYYYFIDISLKDIEISLYNTIGYSNESKKDNFIEYYDHILLSRFNVETMTQFY